MLVYLCLWVDFMKSKISCKNSELLLNDPMFLKKTLPSDVFDNVLQTAKHRTNDASKDVNHPPLLRHASSACAFLNYLRLF